MQSNSQNEIELALIIWSNAPESIAGQIAALELLGSYRLLPQKPLTLHDRYLDTPDGALQQQRIGLRLRTIGPANWLTFKGPAQSNQEGVKERLEIEVPWSAESVTRIVGELADRGIDLRHIADPFDQTDPMETLANLGLRVIQERTTSRQIRNIASMGKADEAVLAELAIDRVTYHFEPTNVCFWELEIEAKSQEGADVIRSVAHQLLARFGENLRRWHHSKMATGKAIERLLKEGELEGLIDADGSLKPTAYDRIDDVLSRGTI